PSSSFEVSGFLSEASPLSGGGGISSGDRVPEAAVPVSAPWFFSPTEGVTIGAGFSPEREWFSPEPSEAWPVGWEFSRNAPKPITASSATPARTSSRLFDFRTGAREGGEEELGGNGGGER